MKLQIHLRDQDAISDAIFEAASVDYPPTMSVEQRLADRRNRCAALNTICSQWVDHGAYVTIEIDTDTCTCRVMPVKEIKDHV